MLNLNDVELEMVTHKLLLEYISSEIQCIQNVLPLDIYKIYENGKINVCTDKE